MSALQFLESQQSIYPDLASWYVEMADLYDKKLWHQLTTKLEEFVSLAVFQSGDALIQLYHSFISEFETKINLLKLAHFAVIVSRQYSDNTTAISFLENIIEKLRATKERRIEEPIIYIKMQIAALKLASGEEKGCKELLEEGKKTLEAMSDLDPSVQSSVHWVSSQFHKSKQNFAEFYKDSLMYLAYTSVETLSDSFKLDLAVDLSLAALLGENIFNFGELLAHPIVNVLEGSSFEWLHLILKSFSNGDIANYDDLCIKYADVLNAQPALVKNERNLRQKITILALMELIFSRPSEDRTIPISLIAEKTKLSHEDVEMLLMKTLSVRLMEGVIDQVDGLVRVSWVQPRVLSLTQIASLKVRLDNWLGKVHTTLLTIEAETPDLITV